VHAVFTEFALLLLISAIAGAIGVRLRQPVLIAYIAVGLIVGPSGLGLVQAHGEIELLAQVGVAVLLFVVGLKLDLQHIRHIGPVAVATGLGQLAFTITIGYALTRALGRPPLEALYVAVALTFSSTIIIVKLLADKRELDALHGRIAVGFLIVQDLAVVVAMMVMSAMRSDRAGRLLDVLLSLGLRVLLAGAALGVLMRWILPRVVALMARSQELLLLFAVAWGTGLAALGEWAGFSREAGAFLAGFSLASTAYRDSIGARLAGLRDFLLLFFFLDLGGRLELGTLGAEVWPALVLSLFVLVGNPLIVLAIMGYMGYRARTGFLAGLTVAQISEFSIILVAMGITLGHVDADTLGLVTLVGLVTIALSTYMILYSHPLYDRLARWLTPFERRRPSRELLAAGPDAPTTTAPEVIVFGLGRFGTRLAHGLREAGHAVLGADFDPERTRALHRLGFAIRYGDVTESAFLDTLPLASTRWVVCALPDLASSRGLLQALRDHGYRGAVAVLAREPGDEVRLAALGADQVLVPMTDAIDRAVSTIAGLLDVRRQVA
jgi:Kef-type K+ transport system membrane component KefB